MDSVSRSMGMPAQSRSPDDETLLPSNYSGFLVARDVLDKSALYSGDSLSLTHLGATPHAACVGRPGYLSPRQGSHKGPSTPCHYIFRDAAPPPGDGAVGIQMGQGAVRDVVARGGVGGGWALVGNTSHLRPKGGKEDRKAPYLAYYQKAKQKELSDVQIT